MQDLTIDKTARWSRGVSLSLWVLGSLEACSLLGLLFFTQHPERLVAYPWIASVFVRSYPLLARAQIASASLALGWLLIEQVGWRWVPVASLTLLVSVLAELAGTHYGFVLGRYEYNELLGAKFLGSVPYLIPLSWFCLAFTSYAMVCSKVVTTDFSFRRIIAGSLVLITWALTLDPAMTQTTPLWHWQEGATIFFGVPVWNVLCGLLTSLAILTTFETIGAQRWVGELPARFFFCLYVLCLAVPLSVAALAGLWEQVACTGGSLLLAFLVARLGAPRKQSWATDRFASLSSFRKFPT